MLTIVYKDGWASSSSFADPASDAGHLDGVERTLPSEAVGVDGLVAERQQIEGGLQVANGRMDIRGFHRVPAMQMHDIEVLAEAHEPPEVLAIAGPSITAEARDVGRAGYRRERHRVPTHPDVVDGVAGVQCELAGCVTDQFRDHLGIEPHPCRVRFYIGALAG